MSNTRRSLGVGVQGGGGLPIPVAGVETILQMGYLASDRGSVNAALFWWSQTPCHEAAKIVVVTSPLVFSFVFREVL